MDARSEGGYSARSGGSRNYRVVSRNSNIDESLFGSKPGSSGSQKGRSLRNTGSNIVKGKSSSQTGAVVISRRDLQAMKARTVIKTEADMRAEHLAKEEERERVQALAHQRKQKMLQMEAEAKRKAKKSDIEIAQMARDQTVRKLAEEKMNEESDMVKLLNTLGARAAAFTIRDEQLSEKARLKEREQEYEQRMDMLMEIDRLKDIKMREDEERMKQAKRAEDRGVIMQQMQDRQRRKLLEEEAREQENQAMLAMMRKFEDDDRSKQMKHKEEVRQARLEVLSANERAIQMREHMKIKEREEEEAILAYQAKKDEDLRVREQEEIVRQRLMKERQAKLLAQQEKTQNKQAELDELRARRAAEEKERRERARELAAAQKHRHDIACLQEDRKRQEQQKRFMQMKEAEQQIQEYQAAMAYSNQVAEREREEFQRKQHASMDHRSAILTQINEAEAKRSQEQNAKFEEGRKLNQEFLSERAKLEAIRDKMVSDLEKKGINPKYLAEMKMADIRKLQMR